MWEGKNYCIFPTVSAVSRGEETEKEIEGRDNEIPILVMPCL